MDRVDFIYTAGLPDEDARRKLGEGTVGVLALADSGDAYGIPVSYVLDDDRLLFRFGVEPESTKVAYAAETATATFTIYEYSGPEDSWSVVVRGPIRRLDDRPDDETINELFPPFRVFDEEIEDVEYELYELEIEELTGRASIAEE